MRTRDLIRDLHWGPDRAAALARLDQMLAEMDSEGGQGGSHDDQAPPPSPDSGSDSTGV